jgi:hypothetical protein
MMALVATAAKTGLLSGMHGHASCRRQKTKPSWASKVQLVAAVVLLQSVSKKFDICVCFVLLQVLLLLLVVLLLLLLLLVQPISTPLLLQDDCRTAAAA